ncbi:MAG: serine/threonine-protein kinase, partial [Planctomycetota bacterium]
MINMPEENRFHSFFDYLHSNPILFVKLFEKYKKDFLEWEKDAVAQNASSTPTEEDDKTKESATSWKDIQGTSFLPESASTQPLFFDFERSNRYRVIETLGEGGMGVVERVQDTLLDREVAWKKIKQKESNLLSKRERLRLWRLNQEAKITAILEHPNIVPLYDMRTFPSGETYFIMRKVEGETLSSLLQKNKASVKKGKPILGEPQLFPIFFKICDAVAYAHSRGIVHRDLKPDNIMVGKFGEVYVMDWGIAKRFLEAPTQTGEVPIDSGALHTIGGLGTPGYMAPEQK